MNKKILTISIAAYNVEKYIRRALDSIVDTNMFDDIEVFVIDDGGNDNTYNIAKTYEKKYPGVFYAVHKTNGGYGSTVNYSIDNATGKYFKLLDGDDWYDSVGLRMLISKLKNIDIDMVITNFNKYYNDKNIFPGIYFDNDYYDKVFKLNNFKYNNGIQMHAITYKTNVLKKSNIRLNEHILYTDNIYVAKPLLYVNDLIIYNFNVYNYQLGIINQSVDKKSKLKHIDMLYNISKDLIEFYKDNLDIINKHDYITSRISATLVDYFCFLLYYNVNNETLNKIKMFDYEILKNNICLYNRMEILDRSASKFLKILRMSKYFLYYPMHFVYKLCEKN